jgi:hypothetical protein
MIVVGGNRASNTEPTCPTNYTIIKHAAGANTQSGTLCYYISPGNDTTTGVMTNATNVAYIVVRGYDMASASGPIGLNPAQSNGSSTTLTYPTGAMTRTDGSSMLVTFGTATGATTTPPDSCPATPSSMVLASSTSQSTLAMCYLIGATSATTVSSVTISPTTGHSGFTFEILGEPNMSSVDTSNYLVHHVNAGFSGENCTTTCTATMNVPSTSANNELTAVLWWGYSVSSPTIANIYCNADSGHATWTFTDFGQDVANTTDLVDGAIYHMDNAPAGCTTITVTWSADQVSSYALHWFELRQIATSSALDASVSNVSATAPFTTAGTITTTVDSDLILVDCAPTINNLGNYTSSDILGPYGTTVLGDNNQNSIGYEMFVQTTHGAISPTMYFQNWAGGTGQRGACMAAAFKTSAGAGTAASDHIVQSLVVQTISVTNPSFFMTVMKPGDQIMFLGLASQAAAQWTGISDTLGGSFTTHGIADNPYFGLDCDIPTSGFDKVSLTGVPSGNNGGWVLMELTGYSNSSHTSCYDATAGYANANGIASPYSSAPVITPSGTGETVFAYINFGTGPATAVTAPSGATYFYPNYSGITDASHMTLGGGFAYQPNAPASAQSYTWTNVNSNSWNAAAIALLPAPVTATMQTRKHGGWMQ